MPLFRWLLYFQSCFPGTAERNPTDSFDNFLPGIPFRFDLPAVRLSQYLTPDATARQIAALAVRYFENDSRIMDVCCGTGQLTRALIDRELADFYARLYPVTQTLIGPYRDIDFLSWLAKVQQPGDRSVLLLPHGFIDKQRPKGIQETLRQFEVLYRTPMQERFARTNVTAEIVVLERR